MVGFNIQTDRYQGPLETLLNLIEGRKLSVSQISLAEVTDAYVSYVEQLPELPLPETSQFILVASTLLLIKSRTLLPTLDLSDDERESVEELERRLARYGIIRRASKILRREWGREPLIFAQKVPAALPVFAPAEADTGTILMAARKLLSLLPKPERLAETVVAPVVALEDVIKHLKTRLQTAFRTRFSDLVRTRSRPEVIVHFLAVLELVRSGSASATQERLFEDILIESEATGLPRYG